MKIDKIPIHLMTEGIGDDSYHLGSITITKGEYANSQKLNEIIDFLAELDTRVKYTEKKVRFT